MSKSFADILKEEEQSNHIKLQAKLPSWASIEGLEIPSSINLEQCSSELAAKHKASLIAQKFPKHRIADLTGGLGVDSWAFSTVSEAVFHNEMNATLSAAAERNFARLGVNNVIFTQHSVGILNPDDWIRDLKSFSPDIIFLDPARRNATGKKVFLLEDCSPDFMSMRVFLQEICPRIVLKISPMADISMLISRIGRKLCEIHIVSIKGEVKELLCFIDNNEHEEPVITASEIDPEREFSFSFSISQEKKSIPIICNRVSEGDSLLELSPALLKAGCFNLLSERYGLKKLSRSTHLYSGILEEEMKRMFKLYRICRILPFNSEGMNVVRKEYSKAEVIAKDIPLNSEQLRTRLKIKPGGEVRIYGCRVGDEKMLIICNK